MPALNDPRKSHDRIARGSVDGDDAKGDPVKGNLDALRQMRDRIENG